MFIRADRKNKIPYSYHVHIIEQWKRINYIQVSTLIKLQITIRFLSEKIKQITYAECRLTLNAKKRTISLDTCVLVKG